MSHAPQKQPEEAAAPVVMDPATLKLLSESQLSSATISHHGYFPKEIVRYLASMLKDAGVPCEIGYDMNLASSKTPEANLLKEQFHDSKPYYFLAFPLEVRKSVIEVLAGTNWPVKPDAETDKLADSLEATKVSHVKKREKRRSGATIAVIGIAIFALLLFLYIGRQLL